jgi:small subunit ribosomal protein S8
LEQVGKEKEKMKRLNEAISSIKNGLRANKSSVKVFNSSFIRGVLNVLKENGYIDSFFEADDAGFLNVNLRYFKGQSVVKQIRMLSTCGSRVYAGKMTAIPRNFSVIILSTDKGIMSHMQAAKLGIGGQRLVEVF